MLVYMIILAVLSATLAILCTSVEILPLYSDDYEEITDTMTYISLTANFQTFMYMLMFNGIGLTLFYLESFYISLVFLVLALISVIDLKYKLIPNRFILALILSIMLLYSQDGFISIYEMGTRLMSAIILFVALFLIAYFTNGQFGGADIKILTVLAFLFDTNGLTVMLVIISILLVFTFAIVFFVNKEMAIPLVPYITVASAVTLFFGEAINDFYLGGFKWSMQFLTSTLYIIN